MTIEIQPVGYSVEKPTRHDLVGIDDKGNRHFLGYSTSKDQAESWKDSILKFCSQTSRVHGT